MKTGATTAIKSKRHRSKEARRKIAGKLKYTGADGNYRLVTLSESKHWLGLRTRVRSCLYPEQKEISEVSST